MRPAQAKTCPSCHEAYDVDVLFCPRDGTPLASSRTPSFQTVDKDPYLDVELAGQIRVKHLIGIGSMGRVYQAWQAGIDRDVAVKILHRELSGNPELVTRFHREAKVASRLVHPNVVQVLMTGTLPKSPDARLGGELYLIMEHLDGISLLSALCAAGTSGDTQALPLARALHITLQICDAVGEAHAQAIVHRDLKPENVMLVRRGDDPDYVKVLDFGIARLDWADKGGMATQAGLIFGTAKYISPEGAEGLPVGPQADVYSIATILYQCLAGRTPFEGDSPVALLVQHTHAPALHLTNIARASYVPAPIAALIMQNLSKKPAERSANARVFGRELVAAARASGLFPEEILSQSTFFSPSTMGPVKLVSKERTKALELSPELAAQIGGVAARPREGDSARPSAVTPVPISARFADETPIGPNGTLIGETSDPGPSVKSSRPPPVAARSAPAKTLIDPGPRTPAMSAPHVPPPQLDFEDVREDVNAPSPSPTIQGTETSLASEPTPGVPRRRLGRLVAAIGAALVLLPLAIFGGRHLGAFGSSPTSVDQALDEARECMNRHAWDSPPRHNLKELVEVAAKQAPNDSRLADLRREASERLVSDALGRKYAGDAAEAAHLAKLALELEPSLAAAQHLVAELAPTSAVEVAPAASSSASSKANAKKPPLLTPTPKSPASGAPAGAVLPPPAAPPIATDPPPAGSGGPWL